MTTITLGVVIMCIYFGTMNYINKKNLKRAEVLIDDYQEEIDNYQNNRR